MRILVAVKSYQDMWKRGAHERIRETWGRLCPSAADVRFFLGGSPIHPLEEDEIHVNARDESGGMGNEA